MKAQAVQIFFHFFLVLSLFFSGNLKQSSSTYSPSKLAPNSNNDDLIPFTEEEITRDLLLKTYTDLLDKAKDKNISLLPEGLTFKVSFHKDGLKYRNGVNIFCVEGYEADLLFLLASRQKEFNNINLIMIPPSYKNLFIQEDDPRGLFCRDGIALDRDGHLSLFRFKEPLPLHSGFHVFSQDPMLKEIGFPLLNGPAVRKLTKNKILTKELFKANEIPTPEGFAIQKGEQNIPQKLQRFLESHDLSRYAVKPSNRSFGQGVQMFDLAEDPLKKGVAHIQELLETSPAVLVEKRIDSPEWKGEEEKVMDYTFRVMVSFDEDNKPIPTGFLALANPKSNRAVNSSACTFLLPEFVFQKLGLDPSKQEEIRQTIIQIALKSASVIQNKIKNQPTKNKSSLEVGLLGMDIMLDEDLNPFVLEANAGNTGGFKHLSELLPEEEKLNPVLPILRRLVHLARITSERPLQQPIEQLNKGTKRTDLKAKEYLAWREVAKHFLERKELKKAEAALKLSLKQKPNDTKSWVLLAKIRYGQGKLDQAISTYRKILQRNPFDMDAWQTLAVIYASRQMYDLAFQTFIKMPYIPSHLSSRLITLGRQFLLKGKFKKAETLFQLARKSNPDLENFLKTKMIPEKDGLVPRDFYLNQIALNPKDAQSFSGLALFYLQHKDRESLLIAKRLLNRAFELSSDPYYLTFFKQIEMYLAPLAEPSNNDLFAPPANCPTSL